MQEFDNISDDSDVSQSYGNRLIKSKILHKYHKYKLKKAGAKKQTPKELQKKRTKKIQKIVKKTTTRRGGSFARSSSIKGN